MTMFIVCKVQVHVGLKGCLHGGRKILEGETNFHLVYMQKFWSGWLLEINCQPSAAERLAATIFVFLSQNQDLPSEGSLHVHGARIFISLS